VKDSGVGFWWLRAAAGVIGVVGGLIDPSTHMAPLGVVVLVGSALMIVRKSGQQ
jgi:hypothetical protein